MESNRLRFLEPMHAKSADEQRIQTQCQRGNVQQLRGWLCNSMYKSCAHDERAAALIVRV